MRGHALFSCYTLGVSMSYHPSRCRDCLLARPFSFHFSSMRARAGRRMSLRSRQASRARLGLPEFSRKPRRREKPAWHLQSSVQKHVYRQPSLQRVCRGRRSAPLTLRTLRNKECPGGIAATLADRIGIARFLAAEMGAGARGRTHATWVSATLSSMDDFTATPRHLCAGKIS